MPFYTYNPQAIKLDASRGIGGIVVELQDFSLPPPHCGIAEEVWESSMCSTDLYKQQENKTDTGLKASLLKCWNLFKTKLILKKGKKKLVVH